MCYRSGGQFSIDKSLPQFILTPGVPDVYTAPYVAIRINSGFQFVKISIIDSAWPGRASDLGEGQVSQLRREFPVVAQLVVESQKSAVIPDLCRSYILFQQL